MYFKMVISPMPMTAVNNTAKFNAMSPVSRAISLLMVDREHELSEMKINILLYEASFL